MTEQEPRPVFFPGGTCRHHEVVDCWAKVYCIRTEDGHTEHETAAGKKWTR